MSVERLITDNIDVWTSTVKTKSASGRGSSKKIDLYGIKKLRELILELAVRGKLVPQDPTDEPASVLLERIAEEKVQLVKSKKFRKSKELEDIKSGDFPYSIPESWQWCYLSDVGAIIGGGTPKSGEVDFWTDDGVKWLTPADLYGLKSKLIGCGKRDITELGLDKSSAQLLPKGSVLFSSRAPIGYTAIAANELATNQGFKSVVPVFQELSDYVYYFLKRSAKYIDAEASGTTFKEVSGSIVAKVFTPLPPLAEQNRIVTKVDELMSLCDQLEQQTETSIEAHQTLVEVLLNTLTLSADTEELMQNWQRISEHFDALFTTEKSIDTLKQTILQLAVMGKLVPQDPNDEPAAKLLERIAEDKAQLIKDKKIKKQKALPEISEDEKPFNLPSGWEWERIGNLSHFIEYGSSQKTVESLPNGVPVLKMGDIQNGKLILGEHKVMSSDVDELPNLYVKNNDVLYNRTNSAELVGKTGIFKGVDDKYSFASYLIRIRCNQESIFPDYLNLSMNTPQFRISQIEPHIKKQCGQANVNGTLMKSMLVSLPPRKEQKRIFNKVNELIMMCDQLKTRLKESQTTQLHLTDAIIDKAL